MDSKNPQRAIRIHVNTENQERPIVVNYRQLYNQKTTTDDIYEELIKKTKTIQLSEAPRQVNNEYDYSDPFIDDSDIVLPAVQENRTFYSTTNNSNAYLEDDHAFQSPSMTNKQIRVLMERLKRDIKHELFENKAKFPVLLKPTVLEIGLVLFREENRINQETIRCLMKLLPYNQYTLNKFLTTKSGQLRISEIEKEITNSIILLRQKVNKHTRFKFNQEIKQLVYDIIQLNEKIIQILHQIARYKPCQMNASNFIFKRLLECWPKGVMNSIELNRQYQQHKLMIITNKVHHV